MGTRTHISTLSPSRIPGSKSQDLTAVTAALSKISNPLDFNTLISFAFPVVPTKTSSNVVPWYRLLLATLGYSGRGFFLYAGLAFRGGWVGGREAIWASSSDPGSFRTSSGMSYKGSEGFFVILGFPGSDTGSNLGGTITVFVEESFFDSSVAITRFGGGSVVILFGLVRFFGGLTSFFIGLSIFFVLFLSFFGTLGLGTGFGLSSCGFSILGLFSFGLSNFGLASCGLSFFGRLGRFLMWIFGGFAGGLGSGPGGNRYVRVMVMTRGLGVTVGLTLSHSGSLPNRYPWIATARARDRRIRFTAFFPPLPEVISG